MRCVTKKIKHIVFTKVTMGQIDFMNQKELFPQKKKFNAPMIALVAAVFGLGPIMWPVMTSCEDNLIRTMLVIFIQLKAVIWMDGEERWDLAGQSNLFIVTWSPITTKRVQQTPNC